MVHNRKIQRRCVDISGQVFKPITIPMKELETIILTKEEITALYYADYLDLKQNDAAEKMHISQASFSREIKSAHKKIVSALFQNKALVFNIEPSEISENKQSDE